MTDQLRLSPAQSAYLDFETEWTRRNADLLRGLGHDGLLELTGLMLAQRRALGLPTRLRAIVETRFPPADHERESLFLNQVPEGCGACLTEMEDY